MRMWNLDDFCRVAAHALAHPTYRAPRSSVWKLPQNQYLEPRRLRAYLLCHSFFISCLYYILSLPPLFPCLLLSQDYTVTLLYDLPTDGPPKWAIFSPMGDVSH